MHLHYSPFQFATAVEVATNDVNVGKVLKTLKSLTKKDTAKTKNMGSTMTVEEAARIPGTPNAFISPNNVGVMKDLSMPMAPTGKAEVRAPKAYDHSYRQRGRVGYGDRKMPDIEERVIKAGGYM
jgi:hypothetical protein